MSSISYYIPDSMLKVRTLNTHLQSENNDNSLNANVSEPTSHVDKPKSVQSMQTSKRHRTGLFSF